MELQVKKECMVVEQLVVQVLKILVQLVTMVEKVVIKLIQDIMLRIP